VLKRFFDIFCSMIGITLLAPLFLLICLLQIISAGFPIFYIQKRVGKNSIDFNLYKFRTMRKDSDKLGLLTVGGRDPRVTRLGYYLRKYKIDELPQLFNVLLGTMSLVGPRPEVRKYVDLYTKEQLTILNVKPGITDYASLQFFNENDLLAQSSSPEETYIQEIMPIKLGLNLKYIEEQSFFIDIRIMVKTVLKIVK
jgi:lipopolysaccharide/colanic/teichoic acid biosynthesis glycosyltransferase